MCAHTLCCHRLIVYYETATDMDGLPMLAWDRWVLHPLVCAKATFMTRLVAHGCLHFLYCIVCGTWNAGVLDLACPYVILITFNKDDQ